jgi:hypothetical protein
MMLKRVKLHIVRRCTEMPQAKIIDPLLAKEGYDVSTLGTKVADMLEEGGIRNYVVLLFQDYKKDRGSGVAEALVKTNRTEEQPHPHMDLMRASMEAIILHKMDSTKRPIPAWGSYEYRLMMAEAAQQFSHEMINQVGHEQE